MNDDPWGAWRPNGGSVAAFVESAARFARATQDYAQGAAHAPHAAARAFGEFLELETAALWSFPWATGPSPAAAPWADLELPALGLTREQQLRWQRVGAAASRIGAAQCRLHGLWSAALRDAAGAFVAGMDAAGVGAAGVGAADSVEWSQLYDAWINEAETAYARVAHGAAFCDALAEFVNAGSAWRTEVGACLEHWSKLLDLPTRSELNSLHRRLKSLEEELRRARARRPKPAKPAKPRRAGRARAAKRVTRP